MITQEKLAKLLSKLEELSKQKLPPDDGTWYVSDACGGNFEDAYELGVQHGETMLAQELFGELTRA